MAAANADTRVPGIARLTGDLVDSAVLHSLIDFPHAEPIAFALMLLPAVLAVVFIATLGSGSAPRWSRRLVPGSVHRAVRIGLLLLAVVPPAVITLTLVDDAQRRESATTDRMEDLAIAAPLR